MRFPSLSALLLLALSGCGASWVSDDVDGDGKSIAEGDCNDFDASVAGGMDEIWYDGIDQDCDGNDDDQDGDGFAGAEVGGPDCWDNPNTSSEEYTALNGFPQLTAALVNPDAGDVWYDGVDADCAGDDDFDQDQDGHASTAWTSTRTALPVDDCYDRVEDTYPAATPDTCGGVSAELPPSSVYGGATDDWYDGTDADCAGNDDFDADGDGFGRCEECDDTRDDLFPSGEPEGVWYDGEDDNCDGNDGDRDGDGFYIEGYIALATAAGAVDPEIPIDYIRDQYDCWDDPTDVPDDMTAVNGFPQPGPEDVFPADEDAPGAEDAWYDGVDADCAGDDDFDQDRDNDPTDQYPDRDGVYGTDCDDENGAIYTGASEDWYDGVDSDCAGDDDYDQDGDGYASDNYIVDGVRGTDCDDDAGGGLINPGMNEDCSTGEDDNCDGSTNLLDAEECTLFYLDSDGDGHATGDYACYCVATGDYTVTAIADTDDCNDADADINPDITEVTADGVDNDCDGKEQCFVDSDSDTFGSSTVSESSTDLLCTAAGEADNDEDCDDTRPTVYPGAEEVIANGRDDSCDDIELCYADVDEDGYGDDSTVESPDVTCATGSGEADDADDCDDRDSAVNPSESETVANGVDDNCDGQELCHLDADGDGYGSGTMVESADLACSTADGEADDGDDCNDSVAIISPAAVEIVADGVDNDCDGLESCYLDADKDGYGVSSGATVDSADLYCIAASGEANDKEDCDDTDRDVNPGQDDTVANGTDDDCNGLETCYVDSDRDTYGSTTTEETSTDLDCSDPGESGTSNDCNDSVGAVNPGASDVAANGTDDDCDGFERCYVDSDGDHYGTTSTSETSTDLDCSDSGEASVSTDCNDSSAVVNPGVTETVANSRDDDCDGLEACYTDSDHDGYGSTSSTEASSDTACTASGESSVSTDCDDAVYAVNPGVSDTVANGVDDNCDGTELCYVDSDKDGYGTSAATTVASSDLSCSSTSGEADDILDCNDASSAIKPSASETVGDGVDYNCDTKELCYVDGDKDGYGTELGSTVESTDLTCSSASGEADDMLDCDDGSSAIKPSATEGTADGVDQNCDDQESCYTDVDKDTYGSDTTATISDLTCSTSGYANDSDDCNDGNSAIKPGASETVADGVDYNCDTKELCYVDGDKDGYGTELGTTVESADMTCSSASGEADDVSDCDDGASTIHPTATEAPGDGVDQDCDEMELCYVDGDLDGYGSGTTDETSDLTCSTSGYADDADDCDDTTGYVKPGATELCDGRLNNCSAAWAASTEDNYVSFESATGAWSDVTSTFSSGTSASSSNISATADGTYHICSRTTGDGMWWGAVLTSGYDLTLKGRASSGDAPILSRSGQSGSLLVSSSGVVEVKDLTLIGGLGSSSGAYGGVLLASGSADVTLSGCDIEGGSASTGARLLVRTGASLTVENSTITAGTETEVAVYGAAIGVLDAGTVLDITNSTITGNSSDYGTIYVEEDGVVSCTDSDIVGNTATLYGGALYFDHNTKGEFVSVTCTYGNTSGGAGDADVARYNTPDVYTFDAAGDANGTFTCGTTCADP